MIHIGILRVTHIVLFIHPTYLLQTLQEGAEVEFFIIAENSRGKMSDRAVHLSTLPAGSVLFEVGLGLQVLGTVTKEPLTSPREEPGNLVLHAPIARGDEPALSEIELWPRCMNSAITCKAGDVFRVDVKHYRPDNLIFARNIVVEKFSKLGRCVFYILPFFAFAFSPFINFCDSNPSYLLSCRQMYASLSIPNNDVFCLMISQRERVCVSPKRQQIWICQMSSSWNRCVFQTQ